eukprot:CAMPEP_0170537160 /NCGR_PEP_ID=MMETSP0209-20121228/102551_1 /TAXON_ID=665100 ORGANISM="Litonotus pictus, Strain P1" /NCGR_SAMPLE_ID=MMETSP0209 /ASSEMBLY_ACC=CAM_ASM_000301 /LENGTH=116 /DNA_ID=CAMNT_0010838613 /DNA_START=1282 /DNA_END=1632 /DNA_ORIENTATION=+
MSVMSEDPMCDAYKIENAGESPQEAIDEVNYIRSSYNNSNKPKVNIENKGISDSTYLSIGSTNESSTACYTRDNENQNLLIEPMKNDKEDRESLTPRSLNSKKTEGDGMLRKDINN